MWDRLHKMSRPYNGVEGLPHTLKLWSGKMDLIVSISNFFNNHLDHIIGQMHVVYGWCPLIYFSQCHRAGRMVIINVQPHCTNDIKVRFLPWGIHNSINTIPLYAHTGTINFYIFLNWRGCWDTFWLKLFIRNSLNSSLILCILCLFSFSISLFHSSLRFCIISVSCYGVMDVELLEPYDACPKYWLMITPNSTTRTRLECSSCLMEPYDACPKYWLIITPNSTTRRRLECSGCLMAVVSISWQPWVQSFLLSSDLVRSPVRNNKRNWSKNICYYIKLDVKLKMNLQSYHKFIVPPQMSSAQSILCRPSCTSHVFQ